MDVFTRKDYLESGGGFIGVRHARSGQSQGTIAPHVHEFWELVIVVAGLGIHRTETGQYPISTGDVFVVAPGDKHGYRNTRNLQLNHVFFDLSRLRPQLRDIGKLPGFHALFTIEPKVRPRRPPGRLRLTGEELAIAEDLVVRLAQELTPPRAGGLLCASALFMLLAVHLSRCYSRSRVTHHSLELGRAISYIEEHYRESIALETLASVAHISTRTLTRYFREAIGMAPIEYLIRHRIMRAASLLREAPQLQITEVAFETGFTDSNYFARKFRQIMSVSPREFRERSQRDGPGVEEVALLVDEG